MVVEGSGGHPGVGGDIVGRGFVQALFRKEGLPTLKESGAGESGRAGAPAGFFGRTRSGTPGLNLQRCQLRTLTPSRHESNQNYPLEGIGPSGRIEPRAPGANPAGGKSRGGNDVWLRG